MPETRQPPASAAADDASQQAQRPASWLFWAGVVGLGIHFLLWDVGRLGLNFLALILLAVGAWWAALRPAGPLPRSTRVLLALAGLWAAVFVVRLDPTTRAWAFWAELVTLTLALGTYRRGRAWALTGWGWAQLLFQGLLALLVRPWEYIFCTGGALLKPRTVWRPLLLGLLLLLPIGLCFLALLVSADLVLAHWVDQLFAWETLLDMLARGLVALFFAWLWLAGALYAWHSTHDMDAPFPGRGLLPALAAHIVLGGVLALFALFVALQARYLFAGDAALARFGLTYAQYARRGFGELVTVAVLSLALLVALEAFVQRPISRGFRVLGWGLLAAVLFMLASAAYRLGLYVDAFGWTTTRLAVAVLMAWLAVALLAALWMLGRPEPRTWPAVGLIPFFGFVLSLAVLGLGPWVVRANLQRAVRGHDLDLDYLVYNSELGPERWLAFAAAYPDLPPDLRTQVGAFLACEMGRYTQADARPWELRLDDARGWNWALIQSQAAYARLKAQVLREFPLREVVLTHAEGYEETTLQVRVDGQWRTCDAWSSPAWP